MALVRLAENQLIRWRDRLLKLVGKLPDGDWHLVDLTSGLMDKQPDQILWRAFERNELTFVCDDKKPNGRDAENLVQKLSQEAVPAEFVRDTDELRQRAMNRWQYVQAIRGMSIGVVGTAIKALWEKLGWPEKKPPHLNTVYLWRKKTKSNSDPVVALIEKHEKKGWRNRFDETFLDILRDVRDEKFLKSSPRLTVEKTVKEAQRTIRALNHERPQSDHYPKPGRRLMQTIIDEKSKCEQIAKRFGADVAMNMFRYSLGGIRTDEPLDRCEIDHTPLSIVVCDKNFIPWGRANASIALDVGTRCTQGAYWGAEVPSIVSLSRCIRHAVRPKIDFLERFPNVKGKWDCFGTSKSYIVDNGLEEHAQALRQAVAQLGGATLELCARKKAWFKPHVERYFRNQDLDLLQTLPACTMENFTKRCNFDPKKDLLLRRSTFDAIFAKWIVDIYLREPQDVLHNKAPIDVWRERILRVDQFVPDKTVLLERLFLRKVTDRSLDHEGIEFDCLQYNSSDMGAVRAQLGSVLKVDIWVSDEDLGHIHVCVPGTDYLIRVPCLELKYAEGLTRWQHERNKKAQAVAKGEGRQISLDAARQEIEDAIKNEMKEFRHAHRKRQSRYQEKDPDLAANKTVNAPAAPSSAHGTEQKREAQLLRDEDSPVQDLESSLVH